MLIVYLLPQAGLQLVVPDALEVRGLGARPRAGDEQVAAVLEVQLDESRVGLARLHAGEALVGRQRLELRVGSLGEPQPQPPHRRPMALDVPRPELGVRA